MTSQRRFRASEQTSIRDLQATLRAMKASSLKIEQDYDTGAVEVRFDRGGSRYVFRNGHFRTPPENLRAVERTITYLHKAMEVYGTQREERPGQPPREHDPFASFFAGFAALPDDTVLLLGSGQWYDVLGVTKDATPADIKAAFRSLARTHHPDVGGDVEEFKRLRVAYDAGMKARGS